MIPEVASKWCCGSSSPADPEIGVSAPGGGGVGAPTTPRAPKSGRVKRMVRLAAELLLLLGLLLLTLHITVLRSNPLPQGNVTVSLDQSTALTEVSGGNLWVASLLFFCFVLFSFSIRRHLQGNLTLNLGNLRGVHSQMVLIKCSYDYAAQVKQTFITWGGCPVSEWRLTYARDVPRGSVVSQPRGRRWGRVRDQCPTPDTPPCCRGFKC